MSSLKGVKPGDTIATISGGGPYKPVMRLWTVDRVGQRTVRAISSGDAASWYIGTGACAGSGGFVDANMLTTDVQERFDSLMSKWEAQCAFARLQSRRYAAREECSSAIAKLLSRADSIDAVDKIVDAVRNIGVAA